MRKRCKKRRRQNQVLALRAQRDNKSGKKPRQGRLEPEQFSVEAASKLDATTARHFDLSNLCAQQSLVTQKPSISPLFSPFSRASAAGSNGKSIIALKAR
jgi:hypothetical protein